MFCENSNDDNDLEVAAVLANVSKDVAESYSSSGTSTGPADLTPCRSSTVMTNLPRGNAVTNVQLCDPSNWSISDMAYRGELAALKLLITDDNIDNKEVGGKTPLMAAAGNGWLNVVEFLLERGANVDSIDDNGTSALQQACCLGYIQVAEALLDYEADVDLTCKKGNTALHYAVHGGHKECVKLLLQQGADLTLKNSAGVTPTALANTLGNREVQDTFRRHLLSLFGE